MIADCPDLKPFNAIKNGIIADCPCLEPFDAIKNGMIADCSCLEPFDAILDGIDCLLPRYGGIGCYLRLTMISVCQILE